MKRFIILTLVMLGWELSAQVVITQSTFPSAGATFNRNVDTTAKEFDPGMAGSTNVWNYGGLNSDSIQTFNFTNPSSTPYASDYPQSNLSLQIAPDLYQYFKVDNAAAEELGLAGDGGNMGFGGVIFKFKFNQPLTFMPFPGQFGTNFVDSAYGEIKLAGSDIGQPSIDSVALKRNVVRTGTFDASGSLTVNTENWQNALRYKIIEESTDSVFIKIFGTWTDGSGFGVPPTSNTDLTYHWFVSGQSFPVLTANMNAIGDSAMSIQFYASATSKSKNSQSVFSVYPNPASDFINFSGDLTNVHNVIIYNTLGQKQEAQTVIKNNQVEVSLNGFANGIYIYQIVGKDSKIISTGKFVVEK